MKPNSHHIIPYHSKQYKLFDLLKAPQHLCLVKSNTSWCCDEWQRTKSKSQL